MQDLRQRLPYALPWAYAATIFQILWRKFYTIYMMLLRCAIQETAFRLQKPIAFNESVAGQSLGTMSVEHEMLSSTKEELASTKGKEPLGCALCILCTALLKFCSAISCAIFGQCQLSMQHGPAFLQWEP